MYVSMGAYISLWGGGGGGDLVGGAKCMREPLLWRMQMFTDATRMHKGARSHAHNTHLQLGLEGCSGALDSRELRRELFRLHPEGDVLGNEIRVLREKARILELVSPNLGAHRRE